MPQYCISEHFLQYCISRFYLNKYNARNQNYLKLYIDKSFSCCYNLCRTIFANCWYLFLKTVLNFVVISITRIFEVVIIVRKQQQQTLYILYRVSSCVIWLFAVAIYTIEIICKLSTLRKESFIANKYLCRNTNNIQSKR